MSLDDRLFLPCHAAISPGSQPCRVPREIFSGTRLGWPPFPLDVIVDLNPLALRFEDIVYVYWTSAWER